MGAWGDKIFDNDMSCDCLCDLMDSDDIISDMQTFMEDVLECAEDYIEYDSGAYGLAAACIIDAKLNGTAPEILTTDEVIPEEFSVILERISKDEVLPLREQAISVVRAVASENSEIYELWEENEDSFPIVMETYDKLIQRLEN